MTEHPDLLAALTPVVQVLEQLDVAHQLGGSVASSAYGQARATMDVDLVARLDESHVRPIADALQEAYYLDEGAMREAILRRSSFNLIHQATMMKVDVFVPKDRPYDAEALRRRRRDRLDETPGAREFCVATPEDIVLSKLEWYDLGGRVSERQWDDVLGVLRVQGDAIDEAYLRRWAPELRIADLLQRALQER
ncbi:MAG: hypothetical protein ACYTF8_15680 [Planctomycetota bacterium]